MSYPDPKGIQDLIVLNFCPKDTIDRRSKVDRVPYRGWANLPIADFIEVPPKKRKKYKHLLEKVKVLIATPGNVVDYNILQDHIIKYAKAFGAGSMLFDRYNATQLVTNLEDAGLNMLQFAQTTMYYSHPTKEFEKLALSGKLRTGGNPILAWCLTGCGLYIDPNENVRPSKKHSTKRIDPIIAAVMAQAGILSKEEVDKKQSAYNDDGKEFYA